MKKRDIVSIYALLIIGLLFIPGLAAAQEATPSPTVPRQMTAAKWREDIRFLYSILSKRPANLFHSVGREKFESELKALDVRLEKLDNRQIILELARIAALIHEGHTRVNLPRDGEWKFERYKIEFFVYEDGLYVQSAPKELGNIAGKRVLKIGDIPADRAITLVRPFIHRDNDMTVKALLPSFLNTPEILEHTGILKAGDDLSLTVEDKSSPVTVTIKRAHSNTSTEWRPAADPGIKPPLYLQKTSDNYWFEYLEPRKTVYVQFNSVRDKREETIAQFADRLYKFVRDNAVEKLVLDIRLNDGGNSRLAMPLLEALIRSEKINQRGRFFTIIGRDTFSAAMVFAVELENHTQVTFVGEPTGGAPNQYGEMLGFHLPNSNLFVNYAAYYFQTAGPFDNRPWLAPSVAVPPTMDAFTKRGDPALQAALSWQPSNPLSARILDAYNAGGTAAAIAVYKEYKNAPVNVYVDTEREVRTAANRMQALRKFDDSIAIFELNIAAYPERAAPYLSVAEAYLEKGDRTKAKELYTKGQSLLERDSTLHLALMERLKLLAETRLRELNR